MCRVVMDTILSPRQINWTVEILPTLTLHSSMCKVNEVVHETTLHSTKLLYTTLHCRAQELCESRGGQPGLPVANSLYRLCGRKATLSSSIRRFLTEDATNTRYFLYPLTA